MESWVGKVAIVTGASSGIGAETAEALVRAGIKVVGLARRIEKIHQLADKLKDQKAKLYPIACDVQKEDDIIKAFKWVESELGGVDILINNAGVFRSDPIIESSSETFRNILDVNVLAFAICTREAVKSMRKRNVRGHIIVTNSVIGHNAESILEPVNICCASKYAVTGMTGSLRNELASVGASIKVTSVSPGLVSTEMAQNAGYSKETIEAFSIKPKDVADAIMFALGTPPNVVVKELTIESLARISTGPNKKKLIE